MKLGTRHVLPFAISLLSHLQSAVDELQKRGITVDDDLFQKFVAQKLQNWNPKINGIPVMDNKTRIHAIGFVSGIALNLMRGKK
tara:strand:- start:267 stop:518 length:252 start_codon:yes stop_codon:yes gene_type:complete